MTHTRIIFFILGFGFLLTAVPLVAHHSFMGEFNLTKTITLKGVVSKVDWVNPHISFDIDVKDERGKTKDWNIQSANPGSLIARGWTRESLKPGDAITVEAYPAKKGEAFAVAKSVTLSNGRKLSANSDGVPGGQ